MKNLFCVHNKVVVITGATGVLCSAMALHLAEQGAKVVILGRNKERGNALQERITAEGGDALFLPTDVLNRELLEQNNTEILARYGRIDVLINGAGGNMAGATVPPSKTIFDLDVEALRQVMDLNFMGSVLPTLVFSKAMVEQGEGSIINISSESAIRPITRVAGYSAAKAAITNFTKYLCAELALKHGCGLRVNAIAPGFFVTEQNHDLLINPDGSLTDRSKSILTHTPYNRFGEPEELLGTVQWLASDASKFVSGTLVVVDGGFDAFAI